MVITDNGGDAASSEVMLLYRGDVDWHGPWEHYCSLLDILLSKSFYFILSSLSPIWVKLEFQKLKYSVTPDCRSVFGFLTLISRCHNLILSNTKMWHSKLTLLLSHNFNQKSSYIEQTISEYQMYAKSVS